MALRLPYKIFFATLHALLIPFNIIALTFLIFYKLLILLLAKLTQDFVCPISGGDVLFMADKIWNRPHCSIIGGFELGGSPTEHDLAQLFEKVYNLKDKDGRLGYSKLGYYLVSFFGFGFWKKVPNFKIVDRIHLLNPEPEESEKKGGMPDGSRASSAAAVHETPVNILVEGLIREPYDIKQPLWDVYIVHNYKGNPNKTLGLLRFHHLMADGMSFVKLFYALLGIKEIPYGHNKPGASMKRWDKIGGNLLSQIWTGLTIELVGFIDYLYELLFERNDNCLQFDEKGKTKYTTNWICSFGKKIDLKDLKKGSAANGCSLVHVLLAGISNGLERYFHKYHENKPLPPGFHFIIALPLPRHPNLRLVNHWCLSKLFAKFGIEQTSEKLTYFKEEVKWCATVSNIPIVSAFTFKYVCGFLPAFLVNVISSAKGTATVILSNMVGPQNCERLDDYMINDMFFFLPICQESVALGIGFVSCNGGARICLTADTGCIPDRSRLDDLGMMMYEEMMDICSSRENINTSCTNSV